ncbi:MAG: hypothetical protein V1780_03470, partial [Chloroflexota bacterium]
MKRKGLFTLLLACLMVVATVACAQPAPAPAPTPAPTPAPAPAPSPTPAPTPAPAPAPHEPVTLVIKTGQIGQAGYVIGVTLAEILNRYSTWVQADVLESLGSTAVIKEVAAKPELRTKYLFTGVDTTVPRSDKGLPPFSIT